MSNTPAPAPAATPPANTPVPPAVSATDARTFLAPYVADPKALEGMAEADLLKYHGQVKGALDGAITKAKEGLAPAAPAPESYQAFALPEGVKLDEPTMGEFTALAKTLKLSQADAQKLVDLGARMHQGAATAVADTVAKAKTEWETASKADKEIGGDQFAANLAVANKVFADHGTPELKQFLIDSGLGSHPEMVRWAFRVGKALSEDKIVRGAPAANSGRTLEERAASKLYPTGT